MPSPATVLLVGTGADGGVGRYERLLVRALSSAPDTKLRMAWRTPHPDYLLGDRLRRRTRTSTKSAARFAAEVMTRVALGRPDVVVFTHPGVAQIARALRRLPGRRPATVVCAHGVEVWDPLPPRRRAALLDAERVVATASFNRERLREAQGVSEDRLATIPLALEPDWYALAPADEGRASGSRLLSVCRLAAAEQYKGVDGVIRALPRLAETIPDVTYEVVGEGDDMQRLQALAAECGVGDRVTWSGRVEPGELLAAYARCDAFVLPSRGEGFGLVFLEAMAFAKPVIAHRSGGTVDVVADGETGWLVADDDELAAALTSALENPDRAAAAGRAGRQRLHTTFAYDAYASRWWALLNDVVA